MITLIPETTTHTMRRVTALLLLLLSWGTGPLRGQESALSLPVADSMPAPQFTDEEAFQYIRKITSNNAMWRSSENAVQNDLQRLLDHSVEPYDSVAGRLKAADFAAVPVRLMLHLNRDSTSIRWLNDSTFIVDSIGWNSSLMLKKETRGAAPVDFSELTFTESDSDRMARLDSLYQPVDTFVVVTVIDTTALEVLGVKMFSYRDHRITPSPNDLRARRSATISSDSAFLVYTDTLMQWEPVIPTPFRYLEGEQQLDSLQGAIQTLLESNQQRDSTLLLINDVNGRVTPFWLSRGDNDTYRFWVKNLRNDSITLWLGNPGPMSLSLLMEDDIDVARMSKEEIDHLPRELVEPDRTLMEMTTVPADPIYWDYDLSSALTLNQTFLSNWTKGGESSVSTLMDIIGQATYNNKEANTQWINSGRVNIGTQFTQEKGHRKNNDLLEFTSKLNKYAYGKVSLSYSLYMKSQVAKGYNYPNDSVIVSKFLNPASITLGLGVEYKPFDNTNINVAPISYKNTFVLDTALIDQTKHGISKDKRAKQELGLQVVMFNKVNLFEDLTMMNRVRLFSNYLHKPQNIDVDWEMLADWKLNWFFTIRLNLHLIYDDEIRFPAMDAEGVPILRPDGSEKKVAKPQFKEFMGLSLQFNF